MKPNWKKIWQEMDKEFDRWYLKKFKRKRTTPRHACLWPEWYIQKRWIQKIVENAYKSRRKAT